MQGDERQQSSGDPSETLAQAIHDDYVRRRRREGVLADDDPSVQAWHELPETLQRSNREQAADISRKLAAIGCEIAPSQAGPAQQMRLEPGEVELLARMEHDRWTEERVRQGWRWGPERDVAGKRSPGLVGWSELPEDLRELDRDTVRAIPALLAHAGLAVLRRHR